MAWDGNFARDVADIMLPGRSRMGTGMCLVLVAAVSMPFAGMYLLTMMRTSSPVFPYYEKAAFDLGMGLALLVGGLLAQRGTCVSGRRKMTLDVVMASVLVVAAVVLMVCKSTPGPALVAVMLPSGVAFAWLIMRCFDVCCRLNIRSAYGAVLVAFLLSALLRLVFTLVPPSLEFISEGFFVFALPLSFAALRSVERVLDGEAAQDPRLVAVPSADAAQRDRLADACGPFANVAHLPSLRPFLLELFACALALGVFSGMAESVASRAEGIVNLLLRIAVVLILLCLLYAYDLRKSYRPAQTVLLTVVLCLLAVSSFGGDQAGLVVSRAAFSLSRNFALIAIYLMALRYVFNESLHPFFAIGLLRGVYETVQGLGVLLGVGLQTAMPPVFQTTSGVFFVAAFVMVLVANRIVIFVADWYGRMSSLRALERGAGGVTGWGFLQGGGRDLAELASRCEDLGARHHLTAREIEVIKLMCGDISKSTIADELGLSVNTVRWHSQNAYAKLGIHSKEELYALLMQGDDGQ